MSLGCRGLGCWGEEPFESSVEAFKGCFKGSIVGAIGVSRQMPTVVSGVVLMYGPQ